MKYTTIHFSLILITLSPKIIHSWANHHEHQREATLWSLEAANETREESRSEKLVQVLSRVGPNLRACSDYQDFQDLNIAESIEAWKLLDKRGKVFARSERQFFEPKIINLLKDSNASESCQLASRETFNSIEQLDSWSIRMWSSTGNFPPSNFLDGQYTDLGSYHDCLSIKVPKSIKSFEHANYCILAFRPVVPSRPRSHMVFETLAPNLRLSFNESSVFRTMLDKAQYFYYLYLKTGVCVPSACSVEDLQKINQLIATRLSLMTGPVKCFTRSPHIQDTDEELNANKPILIELSKPLNRKQLISAAIIIIFFGAVLLATVWHFIDIVGTNLFNASAQKEAGPINSGLKIESNDRNYFVGVKETPPEALVEQLADADKLIKLKFVKSIAFNYLSAINNFKEFIQISSPRPANEIECLHGLRALTMVWIICVHTLQYNQWDGFTRIYENVSILQEIYLHPIYNASYVVDNFFFMSGLLTAYTIFLKSGAGNRYKFNFAHSLLARYLRLTPQVLLISLMHILLPLAGEGPFWFDMTHDSGKFCEKNWWLNLLHIQAFFREEEMCNLVGWWISVDMFYYVIALALIYLILNERLTGALMGTIALILSFMSITAYRHFTNKYTPSNLGTVPQMGEVWSGYVVNLFWSPYAHVVPFYLGLWCGLMLAKGKFKSLIRRWSKLGWFLSISCLAIVSYSSHIWMAGWLKLGNQYISTSYNAICSTLWALSFAWIVVGCHYDGSLVLNKFLSSSVFIILSKASFVIYLSHMLLIRFYFGSQSALIEVSRINLTYIVAGNTVFAIAIGILLCITFEGPCMKFQRYLMNHICQQKAKKVDLLKKNNSVEFDAKTKLNLIN